MSLPAGTKFQHFEILEPIGKGGMGEVYRAKDSKLGRDVAIKVLPDEFAQDEERLKRFQREAKVLASLNHPNIASIYGVEQSGHNHYLVLELVPGETLAERIARGPIPVEEALEIATKIAEALEEAHERGIIHRDLKPANIKITPDDKVKVLDFGLAKAFVEEAVEGDAATSLSPTITRDATRVGVILGTAAYMSPEQAKGKRVDRRTDVFAFGAVLYEMLTARKAFSGGDISEVLAAVIQSEPEWEALPSSTPARVRELVQKCLRKDATLRVQHIGDARVELHDVDDLGSEHAKTNRIAPWIVASFALGAVLAGVTFWNVSRAAPEIPRPVRFSFTVPRSSSLRSLEGVQGRLAMSRDGTQVAYLGANDPVSQGPSAAPHQLFLRRIDESEGKPVLGTEGARNPFFSPDGEWIGFASRGKLQRVPISGGAPLEICKAWMIHGASWGPDDSIIFGGGIGSGLLHVDAAGGEPEPLTSIDSEKGETHHGFPEILPDGRTVLFTVGTGEGSRIAKLSLDTGEWEGLLPRGADPQYLSGGYLAFSENGNLRLARFDPESVQIVGSVLPVLDGIQRENWAGLEDASFAVSRSGDLAFVAGSPLTFQTKPIWVDRRGNETPIDIDWAGYIGPHLSPDGRRIAINRGDELGLGEIWVMNVDGTQAFPFADEGADFNPAWTPDGERITYTSNGDLYEKRVDQDDDRVEFLKRDNYQFSRSWSPDGRLLSIMEFSATGSRIWVVPRDGEPEALFEPSFNSGTPEFAPVGNVLAYVSDESGQPEVYVRRYSGNERGSRVSRGGGQDPVWAVDGRELFYRNGNRMLTVAITTEPDLEIGEPVELWDAPYFIQGFIGPNFDVAADGRFLMLEVSETGSSNAQVVHVYLDWLSEVEPRLAPIE